MSTCHGSSCTRSCILGDVPAGGCDEVEAHVARRPPTHGCGVAGTVVAGGRSSPPACGTRRRARHRLAAQRVAVHAARAGALPEARLADAGDGEHVVTHDRGPARDRTRHLVRPEHVAGREVEGAQREVGAADHDDTATDRGARRTSAPRSAAARAPRPCSASSACRYGASPIAVPPVMTPSDDRGRPDEAAGREVAPRVRETRPRRPAWPTPARRSRGRARSRCRPSRRGRRARARSTRTGSARRRSRGRRGSARAAGTTTAPSRRRGRARRRPRRSARSRVGSSRSSRCRRTRAGVPRRSSATTTRRRIPGRSRRRPRSARARPPALAPGRGVEREHARGLARGAVVHVPAEHDEAIRRRPGELSISVGSSASPSGLSSRFHRTDAVRRAERVQRLAAAEVHGLDAVDASRPRPTTRSGRRRRSRAASCAAPSVASRRVALQRVEAARPVADVHGAVDDGRCRGHDVVRVEEPDPAQVGGVRGIEPRARRRERPRSIPTPHRPLALGRTGRPAGPRSRAPRR